MYNETGPDETPADLNAWNPKPLVLGDHVFHWTQWNAILRYAVELQGTTEVTFFLPDLGREITFRDPLLSGETRSFLREGLIYGIIGLGEKIVNPNFYHYEFMYTGRIDGGFHGRLLSQGVVGRVCDDPRRQFPTSNKKDWERILFHYARELYFWSRLQGSLFSSVEEKRGGIPIVRREANDFAMEVSKVLFHFKGQRYRDNSLPRYP